MKAMVRRKVSPILYREDTQGGPESSHIRLEEDRPF